MFEFALGKRSPRWVLLLIILGRVSLYLNEGVLVQIRNALKPDGFFLAAMFGGETLFELRCVHDFASWLPK